MATKEYDATPARLGTGRIAFVLCVLLGINTMNFYDRQVLGVVGEPLRKHWNLDDRQLGQLGTAFVLLYAVVGVPLGRWADVGKRTRILAVGILLWSVLTGLSGLAWSVTALFLFRLGVGIGEASCAPAANSLLGDFFPAQKRARAISLFMLGLPLGLGLSSVVSGEVAQRYGWRAALLVAGVPGLLLGLLVLAIPEPPRGAAEKHAVGAARRQGSPLLAVLRIPTMWWIILSGALHNFNMYALGHFLAPLLERYYGLTTRGAGWVGGLVYGLGGAMILLGGWACDRASRRRVNGRLEVATAALLLATPCIYLALRQPRGEVVPFTAWLLPGYALFYFYYAGVYATIQDIVEPALRGTAMALYFFAMYLLGGAMGPYATGWVSDYCANRARAAEVSPAGAVASLAVPPEAPFPANLAWAALAEHTKKEAAARATGLHDAMYLVPVLAAALVLVMFLASRTVRADHERLQKWMQSGPE
jgi:MFS family permease